MPLLEWEVLQVMLKPRHAILKQGQSLYRNGVPHQFSEAVGCGIAHSRFMDDGAEYTSGPMPPVVGPGVPMSLAGLPFAVAVNGVETSLATDTTVTKAVVRRAFNTRLQQTQYPQATRNRVQHRVLSTDKIDSLEILIPGVKGFGSAYNTDRDGKWDGRVSGKLADGRILHVYVQDAREKFPRGYRFNGNGLYLTLHANLEPKDTSKAGVTDLRAFLTGTFSTALPPEYAALLTNDPDIKAAAQEISASDQATRVSDTCMGMDFWLSLGEPVDPQPPLVLLDGFESPIWSKPKPGVGNESLSDAEQRILSLAQRKLSDGPRGSILYGDFPEQPNSFYRVRGNNHYFWTTLAWRSVLRTNSAEWYTLARAFSNYLRDSCWLDGQQDHGKGLLPWSGPRSSLGHWPDPEALLMAWLCDGDALSLLEYERWLKVVTQPTETSREAVVPMRMFRVAAWYTGDAKWTQWADTIETRMHAAIKAGVAMTGPGWHPLAYKVPPNLSGQCPEGILSIRQLAAQQKLDDVAPSILYFVRERENERTGFGPLGEGLVGLQFEAPGGVYDFYRARHVPMSHRVIYGTSADSVARIWIEKTDDRDSTLTIRLGQRIGGDFHPQQVFVTDPAGVRKELTAGERFPRQPPLGDQAGWIDGWQCAFKSWPLAGKPGRYLIEVTGYKPMVFGPLSEYCEWQVAEADCSYAGQDADGLWPVGNVLIGNEPDAD
jgi:hypothetical protein